MLNCMFKVTQPVNKKSQICLTPKPILLLQCHSLIDSLNKYLLIKDFSLALYQARGKKHLAKDMWFCSRVTYMVEEEKSGINHRIAQVNTGYMSQQLLTHSPLTRQLSGSQEPLSPLPFSEL